MPITSKGFPVLFTFDLDAETMWTSRDPKNAERPIIMSQGAYGWKAVSYTHLTLPTKAYV